MTTRVLFEKQLWELHRRLEEMGDFAEKAIDMLAEAFERRDGEKASEIIRNDRIISDMERSIEAKCLSIITRQQPVAGDLRAVTAVLKAVTDIERIGDHAVDMAELFLRLGDAQPEAISVHLPAMLDAAREMVHEAVGAFVTGGTDAAERVILGDDIVDGLFNRVKYDVIKSLKAEKENADHCIDLMMFAKYLEKVGDHAVNIAEWAIFKETGSIDKVRLL